MQDLAIVIAINLISKCRCIHTEQYSAIISRFSVMASFAHMVQSATLQIDANFLNQFVTFIYAG